MHSPSADPHDTGAPTPTDLRDSVRDYRDPRTTQAERDAITSRWESIGVANQFAAMLRAAESEARP